MRTNEATKETQVRQTVWETKMWTLSLCKLFFINLLTVYLLPADAFSVIGKRITGAVGDSAVVRCSVIPSNLTIERIEWLRVVGGIRTIVFVDRIHKQSQSNVTSKIRKFTGRFSKSNSSHDLIIQKPQIRDRGLYICEVKCQSDFTYKEANVDLTLVAPPDKLPAVTNLHGVHYGTSNCSDVEAIPIMRVELPTYFICHVGGSAPDPVVNWSYEGDSRIHNTSFCVKNDSRGIYVKSASRRIDVKSINRNNTLICVATIPDAKSGRSKKALTCLRLVICHSIKRKTENIFLILLYVYFVLRALFDICGVILTATKCKWTTRNVTTKKLYEGIWCAVFFLSGPGVCFLIDACVTYFKKSRNQEHGLSGERVPRTSDSEVTAYLKTGKMDGGKLQRLVRNSTLFQDSCITVAFAVLTGWCYMRGEYLSSDVLVILVMLFVYVCYSIGITIYAYSFKKEAS